MCWAFSYMAFNFHNASNGIVHGGGVGIGQVGKLKTELEIYMKLGT